MMKLLDETNGYINQEWTADYEVKSVYDGLYDAFTELKADSEQLKIKNQELKKANNRIKALNNKIKATKNSATFKVGKIIMYIPHKLKMILKK